MQDKAIIEIGKISLSKMGTMKPYELFVENMFSNKENYEIVYAVFELISKDNEFSCILKEIDMENVNATNFLKYAYRKGSSRGGDVTFTTKFGDVEKKLKTLVGNQFKSLIQLVSNTHHTKETAIFNAVYDWLLVNSNYDRLKTELTEVYENLSKEQKMGSGLSIVIEVDGERKYLSDFSIIQEIILANGTEDKSTKYEVKSEGYDELCSVCLTKKPVLHGFASPFKYATVDKAGMVSGFFNQKNNWKNYPICSDCSLYFELGKTFVTTNLSSYFYGSGYYIIPKTILNKDNNKLDKIIKKIQNLYDNTTEDGQRIKQQEDKFAKLIEQEEDYFNLNLMFYEENPTTKAIKIKLLLEEILPSRFRKIFVDVPEAINQNPLYKNSFNIKKVPQDLKFSFGLLKTFFEEDFYDLIQKVFMLQNISKEALYTKFMGVIRANYNKMQSSDGYVENTYLTILKAHLTLAYFQKLNIISHNPPTFQMIDETEKKTEKTTSSFDLDKLRTFVKENESFFDTDYKVGIFSVGILVRLVLNTQNMNLGSTPFEKKLKGYNLNSALLQNVYLEALQKTEQYHNFYAYSNLREFIGEYYVLKSAEISKITSNELSFYFVAGLEFGSKFKVEKSNQKEEKEIS